MAEVEWKGAIWRAAYGDLSVKELLTILKGFGPMETLEFEKVGFSRGQISISLSSEGLKQVTLYYLEVFSDKKQGAGRATLQWLNKIFKGKLYVEDPGVIHVKNADDESLLFWIKMYREGLIEALDNERCPLHAGMSEVEIDKAEESIRAKLDRALDLSRKISSCTP